MLSSLENSDCVLFLFMKILSKRFHVLHLLVDIYNSKKMSLEKGYVSLMDYKLLENMFE